jgi:hypothetical protein
MMNPKSSILLVLLTLSFADNIRISASNHAEYWLFTDEKLDSLNYKDHFENKLKLSLAYGDFTLRGVFFLSNPSLPQSRKLNYIDYAALFRSAPINILYGRYYVTFGRGLVLNAYNDEEFGVDNSLYGLKTDFMYLKSRLTLLTGMPRNILFEENRYVIKNDTTDQIRGINFTTGIIPFINLGGRYIRVNRPTDVTPRAFTELFGSNIGFSFGPIENYFEYARQWGSHPVVGGRLQGNGIIFTSSLAISGLGISFQYLDYDTIGCGGTGYRYNEPPTFMKSGASVNQGLDEIGYGISVMHSPVEFLSVELEHNKLTTHDTTLNKLKQIIYINDNMRGILEQTIKLTSYLTYDIEITGGFERLVKQGIEAGISKKTELKPYAEFIYNFGPFFLETGYEHNFISSDTSDYYEHAGFVAIGKSELFEMSFRYERRNRTPMWLIPELGEDRTWPVVELSLDITHKHNLRIRVGAEKGGLVCSGGVCRFEEPFRGVKFVLTSIF